MKKRLLRRKMEEILPTDESIVNFWVTRGEDTPMLQNGLEWGLFWVEELGVKMHHLKTIEDYEALLDALRKQLKDSYPLSEALRAEVEADAAEEG